MSNPVLARSQALSAGSALCWQARSCQMGAGSQAVRRNGTTGTPGNSPAKHADSRLQHARCAEHTQQQWPRPGCLAWPAWRPSYSGHDLQLSALELAAPSSTLDTCIASLAAQRHYPDTQRSLLLEPIKPCDLPHGQLHTVGEITCLTPALPLRALVGLMGWGGRPGLGGRLVGASFPLYLRTAMSYTLAASSSLA